MRARNLGRAVIAGALASSCSIAALDLSGKKCPCASGYVCDVPRDTCVLEGTLFTDSATPDVQVLDAGKEAEVVAPLVVVSDLTAEWATPNSIRWKWTVTGDKKSFRAYEVVVGKSAADVTNRAAGVDILRGNEHPELDLFDARGGKTSGPFSMWTTTDGFGPGITKFVQVHATDVNGTVSSTKVVSRATADQPTRTKILFDGAERSARPVADWVFKTPVGGEAHYALDVDCGTASTCAKRGELFALGIDMNAPSPYVSGDFPGSYLTFDIEGSVAVTSFSSTVAIEFGDGTCAGGAGVCTFRYSGWTQKKSGRTTIQAPLGELRNDNGPLTFPILQQKGFGVQSLELSGTWADKAALRLYNARIRW